jgi:TIR domain/Pentapeptide repeats (8 copies)
MANQEDLDILRQGVATWNQWIKQRQALIFNTSFPKFSSADLSGADLIGANLIGANLRDVVLSHANLSRANLSSVDLSEVNLSGANLTSVDLSNANLSRAVLLEAILSGANLSGANLSGANLNFTDLSHAKLRGTNLSKARIQGTIFAQIELHTTKGLMEIQHDGPSIVQLHTVKLPQDGSALHFLRGAGVPDEWIDFWRTTTMHPIQYHSLFISYSSQDDTLARRLHADLQDLGVRCWFAPEDMKIGDKIRARIDEAIYLQDKLLLLLSEHALASAWVEDEVEAALEKEQQKQREVLFPVRLDESVMQTSAAWAAKLRRTRHIGDFTRWTDLQAYQQAFERVLRDLKAQS